jgi:hypothetical protein
LASGVAKPPSTRIFTISSYSAFVPLHQYMEAGSTRAAISSTHALSLEWLEGLLDIIVSGLLKNISGVK